VTTYRARPNVLLSEMRDGTGVLLHLDTKLYFTLNCSALAVWSALSSAGGAGLPVDALAGLLHERFEVTEEQALEDVEALLRELAGDGLIEVVEEEAP